jgi:lipopolysaccharide export system protein LptA
MKKLLSIAIILLSSPALASDVNLTADTQVEWHQKENKMVAIGNAVVTRGGMNIRANKITAHYDGARGQSHITSVFAEGNVIMKSDKMTAFGNTLDYNLEEDRAILKGSPAKIKTDRETITATRTITYYPSKQQAIAVGEVIIDNGENRVYSNKLISYFKSDDQGGSFEIDRIEIFENVRIVSRNANVTALRGEYFPQTGMVKLFDNVIIEQSGNTLRGSRAESNLNTGVSRLLSSPQGQVSGVFREKTND